MIILLTVIAIVVAGVPLAAIVLVTIASRREESARSMADRAPGPLERAARRLLAFHASGISRPVSRARSRGRDRGRSADGHREDAPAVAAGATVTSGPIVTGGPTVPARPWLAAPGRSARRSRGGGARRWAGRGSPVMGSRPDPVASRAPGTR